MERSDVIRRKRSRNSSFALRPVPRLSLACCPDSVRECLPVGRQSTAGDVLDPVSTGVDRGVSVVVVGVREDRRLGEPLADGAKPVGSVDSVGSAGFTPSSSSVASITHVKPDHDGVGVSGDVSGYVRVSPVRRDRIDDARLGRELRPRGVRWRSEVEESVLSHHRSIPPRGAPRPPTASGWDPVRSRRREAAVLSFRSRPTVPAVTT